MGANESAVGGVPTVGGNPPIPGVTHGWSAYILFASLHDGEDPSKAWTKVLSVKPSPPPKGGVVSDPVRVILPDGTRYIAFWANHRFDWQGWLAIAERGARDQGRTTGRVVGDFFELSDGRSVPLAECATERDEPRARSRPEAGR